MEKKIKVEEIAVVAKLNDGTIRQILTDKTLNEYILSLIGEYKGKIELNSEELTTIEF